MSRGLSRPRKNPLDKTACRGKVIKTSKNQNAEDKMQIQKIIYPTRKEKSPGFIMPSVDSLMKQALCVVRRGQYFLWVEGR